MNTVKLVGTLPRDPFIPDTEEGKQPIALFTVAARPTNDLASAQYVEVKAFGDEALIVKNALTKRTKVEVIGYIRSESWTTGKGATAKKHYRLVVVAEYLKPLDGALAPDQDAPADEAA
jgi:single-stranded DNA-binding protein